MFLINPIQIVSYFFENDYTYFFYKGHVYKGQNDEYWEFRKNKGQSVLNFLDVKGQAVGENFFCSIILPDDEGMSVWAKKIRAT